MFRPVRLFRVLCLFSLAASLMVRPAFAMAQDDAAATSETSGKKQARKHGDHGDKDRIVSPAETPKPVLWVDPGQIEAKDLFQGAGGEKHRPEAPFTFVEESMAGTNPKFDVRDANGKKWRVKLGSEARPEVVASRLLWAMGYFADDDYLLPTAEVANLRLKRGKELVQGTTVRDARFARKPGDQKKLGVWRWKENPFKDTREFNGLRVMMAVMNNWDLKDVNNAVYQDGKEGRQIFLVSDIGATFASNSEHVKHDTDKGNVDSFASSKFITRKTDKDVSFGTPMLPGGLLLRQGPILLPEVLRRSAIDWIGQDIPLADARWMGAQLGRLSHQQLQDAFRAGDFPDADRETFVKLVEERIAALKGL